MVLPCNLYWLYNSHHKFHQRDFMNPILLKQRISKWIEACQFLKSAEIKEQLDTDEWTAIEELSNLWNKNFTANGVKEDALAHIETLKRCEDMHPNNLKIKEMSKALTGVAREMMTKDEATYNEFKEALKKEIKQNRPVPKTPTVPKTPPRVSVPPKTPVIPKTPPRTTVSDRDIKITSVDYKNSDPKNKIINDFGSQIRVGAYYIYSRLHITTDFKGKVTVEVQFTDPEGKDRGTTRTEIYIDGSGNYVALGYGNDEGGYWNKSGYWTLKYSINGRLAFTNRLYIAAAENKKGSMTIEKVIFANSDESGNILADYGSTLYTDTQYLKPKVTFRTSRRGDTTFIVKLTSPRGETSTYDTSINIKSESETWNFSGYGNSNGTFFTAGQWKVQFYVDNQLIYTTSVTINSRSTYRPPVIPKTTNTGGGGNGGGSKIVKILKWVAIIGVILAGLNFVSNMDCSGHSDLPVEYAIADGVKLYQQPKLNSVVNLKLNRGTKLYLVEREGDSGWIKVETDDGTKGYIHESYTLSEEMHSNISKLFANSDPAVIEKFQGMKYQVMKNQALAKVFDFAPGFMTPNAMIVDVASATDKPYEQVAFLITDGNNPFAIAYSFNSDGEPQAIRYSALNDKRTDTYFTSISTFTAYQMKVKASDGKTVTIDKIK